MEEGEAGEAGEGRVLGGGESHRLVLDHQLVAGDVPAGHRHPAHARPALHQPGVAALTILIVR